MYNAVGQVDIALSRVTNALADWAITDGPLKPEQLGNASLQVPLVGSAIVMAYHLSALDPDDPALVCPPAGDGVVRELIRLLLLFVLLRLQILDGQTLGDIWRGTITHWNDIGIQNLNPSISSKLPNTPILLAFTPDVVRSTFQ